MDPSTPAGQDEEGGGAVSSKSLTIASTSDCDFVINFDDDDEGEDEDDTKASGESVWVKNSSSDRVVHPASLEGTDSTEKGGLVKDGNSDFVIDFSDDTVEISFSGNQDYKATAEGQILSTDSCSDGSNKVTTGVSGLVAAPVQLQKNSLLKCKFCDTYLVQSISVRRTHMQTCHPEKLTHKCQYCEESFMSRFAKNKHEKEHGVTRPKKPPNNPKKTKEAISLEGRKCLFCEEILIGNSSRRRAHIDTWHPEKLTHKCQYCEMGFWSVHGKIGHEKKCNGPTQPNKCMFCEEMLTRKRSERREHMDTCHPDKWPYKCSICSKGFMLKHGFDAHVVLHTRNKDRYECRLCEMRFETHSYAREHEKQMHKEELSVKLKCQYCEESFPTGRKRTVHEMKHTGNYPFSCSYCGEKFPIKSRLKWHEMKHTGNYPFTCSYCGKKYAIKNKFEEHVRVHTGEMKYFCSTCGKGYRLKQTLNTHKRWHTGERPYKCRFCGKGFVRTARKHERQMHKVELALLNAKLNNTDKTRQVSVDMASASVTKELMPSCSVNGSFSSHGQARVNASSNKQIPRRRPTDKPMVDKAVHFHDVIGSALHTKKTLSYHSKNSSFSSGHASASVTTSAHKLTLKRKQAERAMPAKQMQNPRKSAQTDDEDAALALEELCSVLTRQVVPIALEVPAKSISLKESMDNPISKESQEVMAKTVHSQQVSDVGDETTNAVDDLFAGEEVAPVSSLPECDSGRETFSHETEVLQAAERRPYKKWGHYRCRHCNLVFTDPNSKRQHQRTHTASKQAPRTALRTAFKCQFCQRLCKDAASKQEHEAKFHKGGKRRTFKCQFCEIVYSDSYKVKEHELTHTDGPQPFKCEYCDQGFTLAVNRNRHERRHLQGEPPLKCEPCGKEFWRSDHLATHKTKYPDGECRHVKIKIGRPPGKPGLASGSTKSNVSSSCKYCGKTFTRPNNRSRHEYIHEKRAPTYACRYNCGKEFIRSDGRTAHEKTVHSKVKN